MNRLDRVFCIKFVLRYHRSHPRNEGDALISHRMNKAKAQQPSLMSFSMDGIVSNSNSGGHHPSAGSILKYIDNASWRLHHPFGVQGELSARCLLRKNKIHLSISYFNRTRERAKIAHRLVVAEIGNGEMVVAVVVANALEHETQQLRMVNY